LTTLLRSNADPFWSRLRDLLRERGVAPEHAALAECFPDDTSFEFGIVVSQKGSVFQFGFDYLNKPIEDGTLSEWEDLTARLQSTPHRSSIEAALEWLKETTAG
jgi:hypothetical protein